MKKILIAFAAIAFTAITQAATYNWSILTTTASYNGYEAPSTGSLWTGATATGAIQYFLINEASYSQSDLLTAMRAGEDWSSAVLISGATGTDGKIAQTTFTTSSDASGYQLTAYVVLLKDDYAYLGTSQTKTGDASGGQVTFQPAITTSKRLMDTDGTADYSNAGWYNVGAAVPEPTSGLLLLLGMAGLALRRRRV